MAIEVRNLTYFYPNSDTPALQDINFKIDYGEFAIITGPSGGGKSTLCKILVGLIPGIYGGRLSGEVYIDGVNVIEKGVRGVIGRVGIVLQVPENQIASLLVEEELAFGLENLLYDPRVIRERIYEVSKNLEIDHLLNRATYTLSGGEAQKVVIGSVLVYKPKILILDEPLAHIDPTSVENLLSLLIRINREEGITVVVIEHRLSELLKYASRVIVLNRKIIFDGGAEDSIPYLIESGVEIPPVTKLTISINAKPVFSVEDASRVLARHLTQGICRCKNVSANRNAVRSRDKEVAISLNNVWYAYSGNRYVLRGVSLDIYRGEMLAIVGPNGSGKTTLIKHFNGLLKPVKGYVKVFGKDTKMHSVAELARHVGIVFQNPLHQFFEETALKEVMFTLRNMGIEYSEDRAMKILEMFKLEHVAYRSPYELSVGEQRRLAIASVVAYEPDVIVLDEPTAGIDYALKMELLEVVNKLRKKNKTIVIVTHDMEFLSKANVDRVVVLYNGRVVSEGNLRDVLYSPKIEETGVFRLPQVVRLAKALKLDICINPLTVEEFVNAIERCF
ncbi:MAG: energy-coupling factor transporter ATPase [Ignisphaera sp.]